MIEIPYFPGCTLKTTAQGFDDSVRTSAEALGIRLVELPEWNCCGATFPLVVDNLLDLAGPARVLAAARQIDVRLTVACTTCYNVLRRSNYVLTHDEEKRDKLNFFIEAQYDGSLQILDVLQLLRDQVGFEKIESQVRRPLHHIRAAAYYGCMVLRPEKEVAYENPENPQALDGLLSALGAQMIDYPYKTECCGSYLSVVSPGTALEMSYSILASAAKNGADLLVTNCPLCQFNLDRQQAHLAQQRPGYRPMPVFYFSQLLGLALGLRTDDYGWDTHHVDPRPILERLEG